MIFKRILGRWNVYILNVETIMYSIYQSPLKVTNANFHGKIEKFRKEQKKTKTKSKREISISNDSIKI